MSPRVRKKMPCDTLKSSGSKLWGTAPSTRSQRYGRSYAEGEAVKCKVEPPDIDDEAFQVKRRRSARLTLKAVEKFDPQEDVKPIVSAAGEARKKRGAFSETKYEGSKPFGKQSAVNVGMNHGPISQGPYTNDKLNVVPSPGLRIKKALPSSRFAPQLNSPFLEQYSPPVRSQTSAGQCAGFLQTIETLKHAEVRRSPRVNKGCPPSKLAQELHRSKQPREGKGLQNRNLKSAPCSPANLLGIKTKEEDPGYAYSPWSDSAVNLQNLKVDKTCSPGLRIKKVWSPWMSTLNQYAPPMLASSHYQHDSDSVVQTEQGIKCDAVATEAVQTAGEAEQILKSPAAASEAPQRHCSLGSPVIGEAQTGEMEENPVPVHVQDPAPVPVHVQDPEVSQDVPAMRVEDNKPIIQSCRTVPKKSRKGKLTAVQKAKCQEDMDRKMEFLMKNQRQLACKRNVLRKQQQVQSGEFVALSLDERQQRNKKKNLTSRLRQKRHFLETETKLLEYNVEILKAMEIGKIQVGKCVESLKKLSTLTLSPLLLKKNPEVVRTVECLRRFPESNHIREQAKAIYYRLMAMCVVPQSSTFMETLKRNVSEFQQKRYLSMLMLNYVREVSLQTEEDLEPGSDTNPSSCLVDTSTPYDNKPWVGSGIANAGPETNYSDDENVYPEEGDSDSLDLSMDSDSSADFSENMCTDISKTKSFRKRTNTVQKIGQANNLVTITEPPKEITVVLAEDRQHEGGIDETARATVNESDAQKDRNQTGNEKTASDQKQTGKKSTRNDTGEIGEILPIPTYDMDEDCVVEGVDIDTVDLESLTLLSDPDEALSGNLVQELLDQYESGLNDDTKTITISDTEETGPGDQTSAREAEEEESPPVLDLEAGDSSPGAHAGFLDISSCPPTLDSVTNPGTSNSSAGVEREASQQLPGSVPERGLGNLEVSHPEKPQSQPTPKSNRKEMEFSLPSPERTVGGDSQGSAGSRRSLSPATVMGSVFKSYSNVLRRSLRNRKTVGKE